MGRVTHSCRSHGGQCHRPLTPIGLRDIATKPAEDTLTTFIDLLEDLDEAQEDDAELAGQKILSNITINKIDNINNIKLVLCYYFCLLLIDLE